METIAAPLLHSVFKAPPTGKLQVVVGGASIEFRREESDDVKTNDGSEELGCAEGYKLARSIFDSAGIDITDPVGLVDSSSSGGDCCCVVC
jgi:hypothetical protein